MTDLFQLPLAADIRGCKACEVRLEARRPVPSSGPTDAAFMFLGQNPGDDEDREGQSFIGRAGEELNQWLGWLNVDRRRIVIANIVRCHTLKNRPPSRKEVTTCRNEWWFRELDVLPSLKVVVTLGQPARNGILGVSKIGMLEFARATIAACQPRRQFTVYQLPHPAYILRAPGYRRLVRETLLPALAKDLHERFPEEWARVQRGA